MNLWNLPKEAWTQTLLKVARQKYGTPQLELVTETTIENYSMSRIGATYGPGDYVLILNPGPGGLWIKKELKVPVSPEYAKEQGFNAYQVSAPRMSEIRTMGETSRALQESQQFTPEMVAQLVEVAVNRAAEGIAAKLQPAHQGDNLDAMFAQFSRFQTMQDQAEERALRRLGLAAPKDPTEESETSWAAVAREALPVLSGIAANLFQRSNPEPQGQVMTRPNPPENPMSPVEIPLNPDERKAFAGAVAMLRPFVGTILEGLRVQPDVAALAVDLAEWIPGPLQNQVKALAVLGAERGPGVLAVIDQRLSTQAGLALLSHIAEALG